MILKIFIFFLIIFLTSNGGHLDAYDGQGYFLLTESLALHKSMKIYPDSPSLNETKFDIIKYLDWQYSLRHNGDNPKNGTVSPTYVAASPLLSFLGVPFYLIAHQINISPVNFTSYFLNSIILALMSTVVFAFAIEIYKSKKVALVLSVLTGVCSFAWPYASSYFQQPLVGLLVVSSCYFIFLSDRHRYSFIPAGICCGLIILAHSGYVILIPGIICLAIYKQRKSIIKNFQFLIGLIPIIFFQMYLNLIRFGSPTDFGYGTLEGISNHLYTDGIYGMFLSPGFGLFVNYPVFLLFPIAMYYLLRKNTMLFAISLYVFVSTWLFFGTQQSPFWHGFGAWGPRYMLPAIPIISIALGSLFTKQTLKRFNIIIFSILGSLGFTVNLLGVLVWYTAGYSYAWSVLNILQFPKEYLHFEWDPNYLPIVLHVDILSTSFWKTLPPVYFGWKTCIPDNFLFCNYGIIPVLALSFGIAFLGWMILKEFHREITYQTKK